MSAAGDGTLLCNTGHTNPLTLSRSAATKYNVWSGVDHTCVCVRVYGGGSTKVNGHMAHLLNTAERKLS